MITHTATDTAGASPRPLDAETAFLGCLLRLPHADARAVLAGMEPGDCGNPAAAHTLALVIGVVAEGHDPHPTVVFAHAQTTGAVTGEHATQRLAHWLIEAYETAPAPAAAEHLKTVVLEHAWRRTVAEHATRLAQAAQEAPVQVLADLADTTTPAEAYDRYRAACGDTGRPAFAPRLGVAA